MMITSRRMKIGIGRIICAREESLGEDCMDLLDGPVRYDTTVNASDGVNGADQKSEVSDITDALLECRVIQGSRIRLSFMHIVFGVASTLGRHRNMTDHIRTIISGFRRGISCSKKPANSTTRND